MQMGQEQMGGKPHLEGDDLTINGLMVKSVRLGTEGRPSFGMSLSLGGNPNESDSSRDQQVAQGHLLNTMLCLSMVSRNKCFGMSARRTNTNSTCIAADIQCKTMFSIVKACRAAAVSQSA